MCVLAGVQLWCACHRRWKTAIANALVPNQFYELATLQMMGARPACDLCLMSYSFDADRTPPPTTPHPTCVLG